MSQKHLLDFGCGDGGFDEICDDRITRESWLVRMHRIHGKMASLYGVDTDTAALSKAQKALPFVHFLSYDGRSLPFETNTFDYVHVNGALHHISDWRSSIAEIARVAKGPVHVCESPDGYIGTRLARRVIGNWHGHRIYYFTCDQLLEALRMHFDISLVEYHFRPVVADILRMFKCEPTISLGVIKYLDKLFECIGVDKSMASHIIVQGVKRGR